MGKKSKSRPKSVPAHKVAVSSQTLPVLEVPTTVRNIQTAATITAATQLSNHPFEVLLRGAKESGRQEGLAAGVSERRELQEMLEELQVEVQRLEKELREEKEKRGPMEGEGREREITRNDEATQTNDAVPSPPLTTSSSPLHWAINVDTTGPVCMQRNTSALHSGDQNPWGSLNRRHRRSHPQNPQPPPHILRHSYHYYTNNHIHTHPPSYPPLPLIRTRKTICHFRGIRPIEPIFGAHVPTHITTPTRPAAATQSRQGQLIPTHTHITSTDTHLKDITPSSTFISDITSLPFTLYSHLFSSLKFFR
jgi:hypothetical protein